MREIDRPHALGQTLPLVIGNAIFKASDTRLECEGERAVILVSCGLRVQAKGKVIPSLRMVSAAVGALEHAVQKELGVMSDLAAASSQEPPASMTGCGGLAGA